MLDEFGEHAKLIATNPHQAMISAARLQGKGGGAEEMAAVVTTEPTGVDISLFLRSMSQMSLRSLAWRDQRAYMLVSDVSLVRRLDTVAGSDQVNDTEPCLSISGYTRGAPLHVDQLVHVPGLGARKILKVVAASDPCPLKPPRSKEGGMSPPEGTMVLAEADPTRGDPLHIWATPNTLIGEQTWPDMAEYAGGMNDEGGDGDKKNRKNRPAGVSDYQAVWLGSDDEAEGEEEGDEEGAMGGGGRGVVSLGSAAGKKLMQDVAQEEEEEEEEDDGQFSFLKSDGGIKLDGLEDMTAEEIARDKEARRRARANEDMEFPDEVDVPDDMLAKDRFARLIFVLFVYAVLLLLLLFQRML
jgi:pre-rRNA-processing protein TSR1